MNRYFEVSDRVIEKVTQMDFNKPPVKETYTEKWDIPEEYIPKFENGLNFVTFRSAESVRISSMWKGFIGAANTGLSMVTSKLNNLFNSSPEETKQADYNESFKPVLVHTGVSATIPEDEILTIYNLTNGENGLILANGVQVIKSIDKCEIALSMYNMFPSEVKIDKGQVIAIGVFTKIQTESASINLTK